MQPLASILNAIAHTPLLKLSRSLPPESAKVLAKVEFFNPGGSVKDRVALAMIEAAEQQGLLHRGDTVIEATTGNTAIGLAIVCAVKKYPLILVLPKNYSPEYRRSLVSYGVTLILTEAEDGLAGAIKRAEEIAKQTPKSFMPRQLQNTFNLQIHQNETAQEILQDLLESESMSAGKTGETVTSTRPQQIDVLVAGVGSGGTIMGLSKTLKGSFPNLQVIGVESSQSWFFEKNKPPPESSRLLSSLFNASGLDELISISDQEAFETARHLARTEGLLVGIESGAIFSAILQILPHLTRQETVVTLFPDAGGRYFSLGKFFLS